MTASTRLAGLTAVAFAAVSILPAFPDEAGLRTGKKPAPSKKPQGLNVKGKLTAADDLDRVRRGSHCKVYPFKMAPDHAYVIDLKSKEFDAYLRIEDAAGKTVAEDDDGGGGLNARLQFTPPGADTYRIIVTTFGNNETGAYTLSVRPIKVMLSVTGRLDGQDPLDAVRKKCVHKVHALKMLRGHTYTIDLRSTQFDAYLRLEDSQRKNLEEDDDGGGQRNARIVFTPEETGVYHIIVTTCAENETGEYSLIVRE
jgi:serine protease Do